MNNIFVFFSNIIKKYTNFMIKSEFELTKIISKNKKVIIIFGHPLCSWCQKIMCLIPYFFIKSLFKNITLKFCNVNENKNIITKFWIVISPTLCYFEDNILKEKFEDEKVILNNLSKMKY